MSLLEALMTAGLQRHNDAPHVFMCEVLPRLWFYCERCSDITEQRCAGFRKFARFNAYAKLHSHNGEKHEP